MGPALFMTCPCVKAVTLNRPYCSPQPCMKKTILKWKKRRAARNARERRGAHEGLEARRFRKRGKSINALMP